LEAQIQLIGIELFGAPPEAVALERLDDRPQALDLSPERLERIGLAGQFADDLAQRINVVGKVRFHEHGSSESAANASVNQRVAVLGDAAPRVRGASPDPPAKRPVARLSVASRRRGCQAT